MRAIDTIPNCRKLACLGLALALIALLAGVPHHLAVGHAHAHTHSAADGWNQIPHHHGHEISDHDWTGTRRQAFVLDFAIAGETPSYLRPPTPQGIVATRLSVVAPLWQFPPAPSRAPPHAA